jgi:prefoldin beta subunit
LQELDLIEEGDKVYKLIGPALVPQELDEAKTNVNTRLDFIGTELKRCDFEHF